MRFWNCGDGHRLAAGCLIVLMAHTGPAAAADAQSLREAAKVLHQIGDKGKGNDAAQEAWPILAGARADQLTVILAGMKGAGPLAENWFRTAVDAVAERALKQSGELPVDQLEKFLADRSQSPRARRLAYEWIVRVEKDAPARLLPEMLDDPSLELRLDAAQRVLDAAEKAEGDAQVALYQKALKYARDLGQVKTCAEKLKELGHEVDTAEHLGFITSWHLIGPFDNRNKKGFDVAYPPEQEIDFRAEYEGQKGKVAWVAHSTEDAYGIVDLNEALGKHKGAIVYAAAEFFSPEAREVDLRLGCINANKVWLNGQPVTANEVYHSGMNIDQYNATVRLKEGRNVVLLKICQNEQEESWAQRWQFQFRVTDSLGGAVRSAKLASK